MYYLVMQNQNILLGTPSFHIMKFALGKSLPTSILLVIIFCFFEKSPQNIVDAIMQHTCQKMPRALNGAQSACTICTSQDPQKCYEQEQ